MLEYEYVEIIEASWASNEFRECDYDVPNCYNSGNKDLIGQTVKVLKHKSSSKTNREYFLCRDGKGKYLVTLDECFVPSTREMFVDDTQEKILPPEEDECNPVEDVYPF